ncbi:membrane protein YfhO [Anseongella ginsenosidimutans]|uniref:Membrane protein YfhO n=1 Tax=Anseongella ginsenosidimutans TaxID=496056 RepID=A0A4R3KMN2_9SPHI|nr:YfhO family protein [Anseongella ginsenosidimutans]QEC52082.1 YfhO family protein [Anseongella ginsenosidimutans]TCS85608.1 membrane protein YfhO [Anseongella ginsenosidimutans]
MNDRFSKLLPHLYVVLAFLALSFIYFSPLLNGQELAQSDNIQMKGMSSELVKYKELEGEVPLWTNAMFSGMPSFQIWLEYPSNIASYFIRFWNSLFPNPVHTILLYLLGAYLLFCTMRMKPMLAALGAIAIAFVSYNFIILEAGHSTKAVAVAYFAPIIAGILLALRGRLITGAALTATFLALEIRANHLQMTYYLMLVILVFMAVQLVFAVRNKTFPAFLRSSLVLLGAVVLAVGVNFGSLWVNYEYAKETIRGKSELTAEVTGQESTGGLDKEYAYQWSQGIGESITFFIPNAYGAATNYPVGKNSELYETLVRNNIPPVQAEQITAQPAAIGYATYWGDKTFTSGPYYFGIITLFLFILGLSLVKGPLKWGLLLATVLVVLLSFGRHMQWFSDLFFDYFPLYNKFRAVESILMVAGLTIPLLALIALKQLLDTPETGRKELEKNFRYTLYALGGIYLVLLAVPGLFFSFSSPYDAQRFAQIPFADQLQNALLADRKSMFRMDALRSLVFTAIAGGILWAFLKGKLKTQTVIVLLGIALLADLWTVNKRFLNEEDFVAKSQTEQFFPLRPADQQILQDSTYFRVYDLSARGGAFQSAYASYYHYSIGGYHAAKLHRYQELVDHQIAKGNMNVINMLNTKYFIVPDSASQQIIAHRNPDALGNAWFVNGVRFVADANEEIEALTVAIPRTTAVVDERFRDQIDISKIIQLDSADASIRLTSYHPEKLTYSYESPAERIAVFSEIYYDKGWKAYVDGKEHPYFRANYVLRAMQLPAGKHTVEFRFHPTAYYAGEKVSLVSSILLVLLLGGGIYFGNRRRETA